MIISTTIKGYYESIEHLLLLLTNIDDIFNKEEMFKLMLTTNITEDKGYCYIIVQTNEDNYNKKLILIRKIRDHLETVLNTRKVLVVYRPFTVYKKITEKVIKCNKGEMLSLEEILNV